MRAASSPTGRDRAQRPEQARHVGVAYRAPVDPLPGLRRRHIFERGRGDGQGRRGQHVDPPQLLPQRRGAARQRVPVGEVLHGGEVGAVGAAQARPELGLQAVQPSGQLPLHEGHELGGHDPAPLHDGQGLVDLREVDPDETRALPGQLVERGLHGLGHPRVAVLPEHPIGDPDPDAGGVRVRGPPRRAGIGHVRVHGVEREAQVGDAAGQYAGRVHRGAQGQQVVGGPPRDARLQARGAAQRGGAAHRAAGVARHRHQRRLLPQRHGRAARRSPGRTMALRVPGIAGKRPVADGAEAAVGELVGAGLAGEHRQLPAQPADEGPLAGETRRQGP